MPPFTEIYSLAFTKILIFFETLKQQTYLNAYGQ